jgi:hypothetical protein
MAFGVILIGLAVIAIVVALIVVLVVGSNKRS